MYIVQIRGSLIENYKNYHFVSCKINAFIVTYAEYNFYGLGVKECFAKGIFCFDVVLTKTLFQQFVVKFLANVQTILSTNLSTGGLCPTHGYFFFLCLSLSHHH